MSEERAIAHFEKIRQDVRDEVKRRIEQRDKYSIQLTIALSAIVVVAFYPTGFPDVLIIAPLVSIYFTVLIMYSYRIHQVTTQYLRDVIEPELARLCGTSIEKEWETYCKRQAIIGIRRWFFLAALWAVCALSLIYLWLAPFEQDAFKLLCVELLTVATAVYSLVVLAITFWQFPEKWQFWKKIWQFAKKAGRGAKP